MKKEIQIRLEKLLYLRGENTMAQLRLCEVEGERYISMNIGKPEADSISIFLSKAELPRPLTHDLLKIIMESLGGKLHKIVITNVNKGIFSAELYVLANEQVLQISARPSDAICLALRCGCAIYILEPILDNLQHNIQHTKTQPLSIEDHLKLGYELSAFSVDDLEEKLTELVQNEDYEKAVQLRDELKRRSMSEK